MAGKFHGLVVCAYNCQIKVCQYFLHAYVHAGPYADHMKGGLTTPPTDD